MMTMLQKNIKAFASGCFYSEDSWVLFEELKMFITLEKILSSSENSSRKHLTLKLGQKTLKMLPALLIIRAIVMKLYDLSGFKPRQVKLQYHHLIFLRLQEEQPHFHKYESCMQEMKKDLLFP